MARFICCVEQMSRLARVILLIGLPYIAAHLTAIALMVHRDMAVAVARYHAVVVYAPQVEALVCSLAILIGGAALFDVMERKRD